MKALSKLMVAVGLSCVMTACSDSADGIWLGECYNESVDVKSGLQMTIKQDGDKLQGILMLHDDLHGSGKLTGYVMGKDVTICSEGDGASFVNITWSGRLKGDTIKGHYRVEPTHGASMAGRPVEKGTFIMNRK